jgi:hypothetical protein
MEVGGDVQWYTWKSVACGLWREGGIVVIKVLLWQARAT